MTPRAKERAAAAVLVAFAVALAVHAMLLGQTNGWDLRNYHLYIPWAWLGGRLDRDLAPAQLQSYFNPLLYVPIYLGATGLPPRVFELALALVQALGNAGLAYVVARRVAPPRFDAAQPALALALAIAGATGATQLGELGATPGDNLDAIPLLGAIALLVGARRHAAVDVLAGALLGLSAGLKLTFAPWAAAAVLAMPMLGARGARSGLFIRASIGAAAGFALVAGPWMLELHARFGNPVFPMFNALFPDALRLPFDPRDVRFLPHGVGEALIYPARFVLDPLRVSDLPFRDLRVPLLYLAALVVPWWRGSRADAPDDRARGARFLLLFAALGYLGWLATFGYYRYLVPLEALAPLLLVLLVERAFPAADPRRLAWGIAALLVLLVATTRAPDLGHIDYAQHFIRADAFDLAPGDGVAIADDQPLGAAVVALGPAPDYVALETNFHGNGWPPQAFDRMVAERLDGVRGALLGLMAGPPDERRRAALARYGLAVDARTCRSLHLNLVSPGQDPQLCALAREQPARAAIEALIAFWRTGCAKDDGHDRTVERACAVIRGL